MAMKIERDGIGFRVTTPGDKLARINVPAKDVAAVVACVEHYYGGMHALRPDCPVCESIQHKGVRR